MFSTLYRLAERTSAFYHALKSATLYRGIFGEMGRGARITRPLLIRNPENIFIGERVRIREGARLETVVARSGARFSPRVDIGADTSVEQGFHLACAERIRIGARVAITEYVAIFDIWHPYEDLKLPVRDQPLKTAPVEIGDDTLIGVGAVVQPGVRIGRHCVIGANAVVTRDIPDFSVAVGAPARVIRRYDPERGQWLSV